MDGTLIDSIGIWNKIDQNIIRLYGQKDIKLDKIQLERDSFLHNHQNSDIYVEYCQYLINKYQLSIKTKTKLLKLRWAMSGEILEKEVDFKPDAVELLLTLKKLGFTLVLATVTTEIQLNIYTKKNKKMISQINIEDIFDFIITKEDVKKKKPNPEIYIKIMSHYHAIPEECLVIEDSYTGVQAAKNAQIEVINIYDKYADINRDKINKITDYTIENYKELISFIHSLYYSKSKKES